MAFPSDLTVGTNTYSLVTTRANASIRSDATQPVSTPVFLQISHETAKDGSVQSVVIIDRVYDTPCVINGVPKQGKVRGQFKLAYNPTDGADIESFLTFVRDEITAIIGDSTNFTKFKNKES